MSVDKKLVRTKFRHAVFERDGYCCRFCGKPGKDRQGGDLHKKFHKDKNPVNLDSHHVYDRSFFKNGCYKKENGISLCDDCHFQAELHWNNLSEPNPDFSPEKLYELIGSSLEIAEVIDNEQ